MLCALVVSAQATRLGGSQLGFFSSRDAALDRLWDLDDTFNESRTREEVPPTPDRVRAVSKHRMDCHSLGLRQVELISIGG